MDKRCEQSYRLLISSGLFSIRIEESRKEETVLSAHTEQHISPQTQQLMLPQAVGEAWHCQSIQGGGLSQELCGRSLVKAGQAQAR